MDFALFDCFLKENFFKNILKKCSGDWGLPRALGTPLVVQGFHCRGHGFDPWLGS